MTFKVPGRKVLSELGGATLAFHITSPFSRQVKRFPNDILISEWYQLEMPLKNNARLIHEMITVLRQAASRNSSPKAIDQTSSIEVTSYFNGAPDNLNCGRRVLARASVHRKW